MNKERKCILFIENFLLFSNCLWTKISVFYYWFFQKYNVNNYKLWFITKNITIWNKWIWVGTHSNPTSSLGIWESSDSITKFRALKIFSSFAEFIWSEVCTFSAAELSRKRVSWDLQFLHDLVFELCINSKYRQNQYYWSEIDWMFNTQIHRICHSKYKFHLLFEKYLLKNSFIYLFFSF